MESPDQKYLRSLIGEGEHQELDFKFEINDARKIARTLSAFSNGGWCFLHIWSDTVAIELYNRVGTLRFRHLIARPEGL